MNESVQAAPRATGVPWHIWLVGILSLLWYFSGAYTIMVAQHGTLPGLSPEELAYYEAKPLYLELIADLALMAGIVGSVGLLLRKVWAVPAFLALLVLVLVGNALELADGTSRALANQAAMIVTIAIAAIALFNWSYARTMARRGVLA